MAEAMTHAQKRAFKQGQVAFLQGERVVDNPHTSDVAFVYWRRGWLAQQASEDAGQPRCRFCGQTVQEG